MLSAINLHRIGGVNAKPSILHFQLNNGKKKKKKTKRLKILSSALPSSSPSLVSSIGSPPSIHLTQWNLSHRHILLLNAISCVAAISASWIFFSAIPTLMAFKRASESLEKLLDVTRKELPDTMAAVRLSGMEISDLTMELSDLGQEITQGVRNSTRAVRMAEDRLRRLTTMTPTGAIQSKDGENETRTS
ncbi:uncharacterized protein LOC143889602 isoform X2 [Tasmannia lanceolata]|uniref:uncharacterized protein LOC143889602 isoform X2 n=1 Tax=Tasmannia lanceolata TaxID=3420 RepID=UPI0040643AD9